MSRSLSAFAVSGSLLALLGTGCAKTEPVQTPTTTTPETIPSTSQATTPVASYALTDIAAHSTASDCWLVIRGKVYNVTSFIPRHPGGEAILKGCGKDATAMFEQRPDGSAHSPRAEAKLDEFYIGDVKS